MMLWVQWCLGHLTDAQLVDFLRKFSGKDIEEEACLKRGGWMIVKENINTTVTKREEEVDIYNELDSNVTRCDATFRRCLTEADLKVVRSKLQRVFKKALGLLPVSFYACRRREE